jgi:hypothetical protein
MKRAVKSIMAVTAAAVLAAGAAAAHAHPTGSMGMGQRAQSGDQDKHAVMAQRMGERMAQRMTQHQGGHGHARENAVAHGGCPMMGAQADAQAEHKH